MNKFLRIGFFSVALAQSLYGVDATEWWQLDENNYTDPPPALPVITDPLTIFEDSTLNITSTDAPTNGGQFYNGSILFNHNLNINLSINGQVGADQSTPIYRLDQRVKNTFSGDKLLKITIDAQNNYAKSVFNLDNSTLVIDNDVNISTTDKSQIFSIIRTGNNNGGMATFETNGDLIVDLSNATGIFSVGGTTIDGRKAIFDNTGFVNINTFKSKEITTQLTGDIFNNGIFTLYLGNSKSFFKGRYDTSNASTGSITAENGATLESSISIQATATLNISLADDAKAKLNIDIGVDQGSNLSISANHSLLYADFIYTRQNNNFTAQGNITLENTSIWYPSQSNTINVLTISNPQDLINTEQFKLVSGVSALDLRFANQGQTLRANLSLDENTRYLIKTANIQGSNGVFRFFGVLNKAGWTEVKDPATGQLTETIATDQIITKQLFNTHYLQIFWNQDNFDKSLLNTNLESQKIIVAKQEGLMGGSDFVGAVTPLGLYNYITNLKKEQYNFIDENGDLQPGWQWIVSDVQRADNSYISKLLDSLFQTQFRIQKTQIDTLNLRMGELRNLNRVHSVWVRSKYGRLGSKETDQTIGSWDEYASIWLGYDQNFYVLGGKNFLGGSFDVQFFNAYGLPNKDDFANPSYTGKSQSYGFSIYDTFFFDNGFYIDALAKYYFTHNRFTIASEVLAGNIPDFFSHTLLASLEVGQRFRLPLNFYLKPDAGFSFAFSSGQDWNFMDWSNQLIKARLDFNAPVNMRTGLTAGWTFKHRGYEGDLYVGTSFEYDFNTGGDLRLEDFLDKMTLSHAGNFNWRINMGTNIILNEYWRIYFDVDTAFFGTINSTFTINGGVRINFGRLHPQMPYIPPRFEAPEDFRKYPTYRRTIPEVQNYETQNILDNYNGMTKIRKLPPKINVKNKQFNQGISPNTEPLKQLSITPKVEQQPQGEPTFIDNPQEINAPSKNYKREQNVPISPSVIPQQRTRSLQNIKENLDRGYQ